MFLVPILFAIGFYALAYGWHTLDPQQFAWLQQRDSSGHLIGWLFYLKDEWQFPLGKISNLMVPIGTSTISTDSIPLASVIVKLIFGSTAQHFQFFGMWLLACYILQAVWAYKIFDLGTKNKTYASLAAFFFVLSPVLLFRSDHKSMCAQWLLLWVMYLYMRAGSSRKLPFASLLAANVIAVGSHAYLLPMVFGLSLAVYGKTWIFHRDRKFLLNSALQLCSILGIVWCTMYSLGFFLVTSPASWGFGVFSADLLQFFNSMGKPTLLPKFRSGGSQHEGFSYLGLGMILLLLTSLFFGWKNKDWRRKENPMGLITPLMLICGGFFFFALSSHITFGGNTILKIEWFYNLFGDLPHIFRSSGRFVWPLYYFLMIAILLRIFRQFPTKQALALVAAALLIQFADLHKWYFDSAERGAFSSEEASKLKNPFWGQLQELGLVKMLLVPPVMIGDGASCGIEEFSMLEFRALAYQAAKNDMSINSGAFARSPGEEVSKYCGNFWKITENEGVDGVLLVAQDGKADWPKLEDFIKNQKGDFECVLADGFRACYRPRANGDTTSAHRQAGL